MPTSVMLKPALKLAFPNRSIKLLYEIANINIVVLEIVVNLTKS